MPTLPLSPDLSGPAMSPVRRYLRRRSAMDVAIGVVAVLLSTLIGSTPHDKLLAAVAIASLATIWFLVRRHQDLEAIRQNRIARAREMQDRGISLAEWKAGQPLPPWDER